MIKREFTVIRKGQHVPETLETSKSLRNLEKKRSANSKSINADEKFSRLKQVNINEPIKSLIDAAKASLPPKGGKSYDECLFTLARANLTLLSFSDELRTEIGYSQRALFDHWYAMAKDLAAEKTEESLYKCFQQKCADAKHPLGSSLPDMAWPISKTLKLPELDIFLEGHGLHGPHDKELAYLCFQMSRMSSASNGIFFLAGTVVARLLELADPKTANRLLYKQVDKGVLEITKRGNERQAHRYKFIAGTQVSLREKYNVV